MVYTFGTKVIEIDVEKTREFYKRAEKITDGCSCDGCLNYVSAIGFFPKAVLDFFEIIGVDIRKAAEIIPYCAFDDGKTMLYGGFYHLRGTILSGTNIRKVKKSTSRVQKGKMNDEVMYIIEDGYKIDFSEECHLLEDGFPMPAIQVEIMFLVPWVLESENTYM